MISNKTISVIIPCRNEVEGIGVMVKQALKVADEVVVVDNRSSDGTAKVAEKAGAKIITEKRVDKRGIGYGYSLRRGMRVAKGEVIVTMDGDNTYPLEQIKAAVNYMMKVGSDVVLCSRFPLVDGQAISWWRQFGVWLLNMQVRVLFGFPIQDILSGMWVINRRALRQLHLKEGGWNLSPEIKLNAIQNSDLQVSQFQIRHYEREYGQSKQKLVETGLEHLIYIGGYGIKMWGNRLKLGLEGWLRVPVQVARQVIEE